MRRPRGDHRTRSGLRKGRHRQLAPSPGVRGSGDFEHKAGVTGSLTKVTEAPVTHVGISTAGRRSTTSRRGPCGTRPRNEHSAHAHPYVAVPAALLRTATGADNPTSIKGRGTSTRRNIPWRQKGTTPDTAYDVDEP